MWICLAGPYFQTPNEIALRLGVSKGLKTTFAWILGSVCGGLGFGSACVWTFAIGCRFLSGASCERPRWGAGCLFWRWCASPCRSVDCFTAGSSWWGLSQGGGLSMLVWMLAACCAGLWSVPFWLHCVCELIWSKLDRLIALFTCLPLEGRLGRRVVYQPSGQGGGQVAQQSFPRSGVNRGLLVSPLARWILCLAGLRVGEAKVPGPLNFRLGVCNPNGLANKAALFAMQESDVWCVSETHLTAGGIKQFRCELSDLGSAFRWVVHGSPVLPRLEGSTVGQWAGVAMIAKCPSRHLPTGWSLPVNHSCRIVAGVSFCRGLWISGIVLYGTPLGPTHPNAKQTTEGLLQSALARVQQSVGCRFVAGDFNHSPDSLEGVAKLRALGFQDIQDLQFRHFGVFPQPTCRGSTRRDFLFVSPELASRFVSCRLDGLAWTDHASLIGEFAGDVGPETRYLWPIPSSLEWDPQACFPVLDFGSSVDLDVSYRAFWKQREEAAVNFAAKKGVDVLPSQLGRGSRTRPVPCKSTGAPLKPSRHGEVVPTFFGYSLLHVHWFKQLRRLQSYLSLVRVGVLSIAHEEHQRALWTSILRAPGFQPCFRQWWSSRTRVVGELDCVPFHAPGCAVAESLFASFQWDVQSLESTLRKHKHYAARLKKLDDTAQLYAMVRRDPPAQVDVMFQETVATVSHVCEEETALELEGEYRWNSDLPVFHQGRALSLGHAEPDKSWVDQVDGIHSGDSIVQPCGVGRVEDLFEAFATQWKQRRSRHAQVPVERWQVILDFARRFLRPVPAAHLHLTPTLLRAVTASKKKKAATGLDGVSRHDLLQLDSNGFLSLGSLYSRASTTGLLRLWRGQ